jgi:hypothetical protein
VFGPEVYTKVQASGTPDVSLDTIVAPALGTYVLWMQNGDDGGARITAGSVQVGATTVFTDADFQKPKEYFGKPVRLAAGANALQVTLTAPDAGAFLTLVVTRVGERPHLIAGRILLPYATAASNPILQLKSGAHFYNRRVRVHYYDAAGALVASSDRILLLPRASLSAPATTLIQSGSWIEGSLEVFYCGWGAARVFGQAAVSEPQSGIASLVPLQHAGYRHRDPHRNVNQ